MRKPALVAAASILLITASDAAAFRGRPVSDLRFQGQADPTWNRRAASDGTDFLVLSAHHYPSRDGVFAQKLSGGEPAGPRQQVGYGLDVAGLGWTGSHYLAGWSRDYELWTAPLSREGSLLGPPVSSSVRGVHTLLATGGTSAMAFGYTDNKLIVRPLDLSGNATGNAVTHFAPVLRGDFTVAAVGDRFAAVFSRWRGTWLMLFRADGSLVAPAILLDGPYGSSTTDYHSNVAIAATDGSDILVAFGAGTWGGDGELVTVVVGPDGTVKNKQKIHTMPGDGPSSIYPAAVRWDGSQYLILANLHPAPLESAYDPALFRVSRGGARIGELSWVSREEQDDRGVDLASNGRELLVLTGFAGLTVDAATLHPRGKAALGRTLAAQDGLTVEAGRSGYLAAWYESDADEMTVRASRVDAAGNYLDGEGIVLATLEPQAHYGERAIAIDGNGPHWFVVWSSGQDFNQVAGRSVSWTGVPGEMVMPIGPGWHADVLWRGSHYVVLRAEEDGLHLDVLRPDGTVAETRTLMMMEFIETPQSWTYRYAADPHLVLLRDRLLAVYSVFKTTCYYFPFCSERAEVTGLWLDTPGAQPFTIDENGWGLRGVAADGERALVVWADYQNLYGIFIPSAPPPAKPSTRFRIDANPPPDLGAAWDGKDFLVTWTDLLTYPFTSVVTRRVASDETVSNRLLMRLDDAEFAANPAVAASAALPPLLGFGLHHSAYETVPRGALLFASEFAQAAAAPPPAPALACVSENADETLTVRWQPSPNALGHAIELQLADGTFRQIGVAAAGASRARVARAGLRGSVVRVRAWNERGLSQPSAAAVSLPAPQATLRSGTRACAGKPVTISYSLRGAAPFTVRWSDGVVQTNLQAAATRTVTVSRDTTLSIVSVNDTSCATTDTRHSIRILVDPIAKIDEQPRELQITRGQTATLTLRADDELNFAWFEGEPGDTARPVGTNAPTFTTPALDATARYWVRVSNRCGSVDSEAIVVTVNGGKGRAVRK